ncbi:MAG: zinc-ribbon domain-containing protein, partial [Desulfobulbaceae bacterium]|nr:zinc-ribbon domain-containing protein [Desulfobulbaceae bacterium]
MVLTCPHCKKQHNIDENLIPPNIKKARCKYCGNQFPLPGRQETSEPELVAPPPPKQEGPRRIGISISKGGVGKTTTAVNLAAGLSFAGFKVLLVDTDTQGQDSFMLGLKPKAGLTELVTEELRPEEAITQARERLWLLSGGKSLAGIKRLIDRKDFG